MPGPDRSLGRGRRLWRCLLAIVLTLVVGATGFVWYIGYFGGPIYKLVAPTAPPPPAERGTVAVFFSGDMGFNLGMGPAVAKRLAAQGIPVLGVNSLTLFAQRRNQAQIDALVQDAVRHGLALPGAARVVLIGQSFGANALLHGIQALSPADRARVPLVEFIVPADTMITRAMPAGVFEPRPDGPAAPYANRLDWVPVLCLYGQLERNSLCPIWHQRNVSVIALPGDHFLNRDPVLVAAELLRGIGEHTPPR